MISKKYYDNSLRYEMLMKFPFKNIMDVPKIEKIQLNFGFPNISQDKKQIIIGLLALEMITGQKAYPTQSKKQIHTLKIRKKMYVGSSVTLRKNSMYFFLDKLIFVIFSNLRTFNGFHAKYNVKNRSISFQLQDLYIFPELEREYHLFQKLPLLDITIVFEDKVIFKKHKDISIMFGRMLQIPLVKYNKDIQAKVA